MRRIAFSLVALLLLSCSSSNVNHYIFPKEEKLISQTIEIDSALFRYAFRIRVYADTVIVMDLHGANHFYHAFKYPEFQYLTSCGIRIIKIC